MGKIRKDDKSDDIEIVSIGKLYNGAWDKKYWSSSRGKDRYPYPVGYKSVRTQNGITFTMEILEGLKGPSFQISSTDGKSCSGDTPEIAWENFQKKGSSKSLHAKRFLCKIDGVEFFGFKNTFVQRLLRELVANDGGTAEQSLLTSKFPGGACETDHQLQGRSSNHDPYLLTYLFTSHAKGKRSRNDQVVSRKRVNGTRFKELQQEEDKKILSSSRNSKRDRTKSRSTGLSAFASAKEVPSVGYTPGSSGPEKCIPTVEKGVKLESLQLFDHLNLGESLSEGGKLDGSTNHVELNIDNLHKQQTSSGHSSYFEVHESINIIPEGRDGATNVQHEIPVASDADLCVADTLDYSGADNSSVSSQKKDGQVHSTEKDATINGVEKFSALVADSVPEDEMVISSNHSNSEKCDADSVGDEIAKSMMTVLLPRAVPLFKTFSRKKRKSNPCKSQRSPLNNDSPSINMKDSTIARGIAEHSDLHRENEKTCIPCVARDSDVCTSSNLDSVVPDSFDNFSPQDLLPHADETHSGKLLSGLYPIAPLPINCEAEANQLLCHSGSSKHDSGAAATTSMVVSDTESPPIEYMANSKRASIYHSMDNISPERASSNIRTSTSASIMDRSSSDICLPKKAKEKFGRMVNSRDCDSSLPTQQVPSTCCCSPTGDIKMNDDHRSTIKHKLKLNSKLQSHLGLFACYIHPMPISMVQLIIKDDEIFVCVKCGYSDHDEDTIFIYKASKKGENMGTPSLVGHVPITLQVSKNALGKDIALERSIMQLAPYGGSLVLLNSIKIPYCREGQLHCSCPACTSDGFEKNAVKIVRLNRGYASLVTRLKTAQGVCCLLVCESSFLLASEEGGKLKLWVMNTAWSEQEEDWYLPTFDCMLPCIVELKRVPNSAGLVVGHNGFGEFGIWDIHKRNLVSRFSSAGMSVLECVPVSVFRWQSKGEYKTRALVADIIDATKMWFSGTSVDDHIFSPEDNDVAAWILISTASDPDHEYYQLSEQEEANVDGSWRLALLVNNMVITGSILDGGAAAAASTSIGQGIIGRCDGQVYMWELSTGKKLGNLHIFKGSRVSCITPDTSNTGALAIASEGQLLVYLPL